jgi:probable HAF family extracellular repeat protein
MTDIGSLGGGYGQANGINRNGQITGVSLTGTHALHAFLYSAGAMQDLGTLGGYTSEGYGINSAGQVVGYSLTASNASHAFLYLDGKMTDLNAMLDSSSALSPYVVLLEARAINDDQFIVANGLDSRTNEEHAYLLDCRHKGKPQKCK